MLESYRAHKQHMREIQAAIEHDAHARATEARQEYQGLRDELGNKHEEETHALRVALEAKARSPKQMDCVLLLHAMSLISLYVSCVD